MNKEEYPELYKEYDKTKNLVPFEDLRKSHKDKVWWVCPEYGHSYSGILRNRVYKLYRCPICSGQQTLPGLYQIRYTYDKDHTHLLEMLQYLLYTVRYDRMYLDHLENNDKGNR